MRRLRPLLILLTIGTFGQYSCTAQTEHRTHKRLPAIPRIPVAVNGDTVWIGGYAYQPDTVTSLKVDGRPVDPHSVEGLQALADMHKDTVRDDSILGAMMTGNLQQMNNTLMQRLPNDSTRAQYEHEYELWCQARDKHCGIVEAGIPLAQQGEVLWCRRWITECRLEDMQDIYAHWVNAK
jgi:hypothetical protein